MSYQKTYETLLAIRKKENLSLKKPSFLVDEFEDFKGDKLPLEIRNYQKIGSLHMYLMPRFVNGDDTGLGKTIQSILSLSLIWDRDPSQKAIIATNKSLIGQWEEEFQRFIIPGKINILTCFGTPKKRQKTYEKFQEAEGPTVLILGYPSIRQDYFSHMQKWGDFILILDECTNIKNPGARISRIMYEFSKQASRCWGLTATLIKRDLRDGWGIFSVVYPGFFAEKSEVAFMKNWCVTKEVQTPMKNGGFIKKRVITGYKREKLLEFKKKIDPFFLSRGKLQVAKELPNLIVQQVHVGLTKQQKEKYQEALDGLLTVDTTGEEKETTLLSQLIYCQQIVDHPKLIDCEGQSEKLKVLIDLLENSDLSQQKVIIFSRFRKMIDILEETLNQRGIFNVRITGAEKEHERNHNKMAFSKKSSETHVCLINEAAKEGMNLQAAETIIFYDTPWTGGDYIQLIGRMIRIGSVHTCVRALHLVCKNTIDQRVLQKLAGSMGVIETVIGERIQGKGESLFEEKIDSKELKDLMLQDRKNWGKRI